MVGYGSKYFAYLMSRAIAANIWQHCFKDDPFSRYADLTCDLKCSTDDLGVLLMT